MRKEKKYLTGLIIILSALVLGLGGYIVYDKFGNDTLSDDTLTENKTVEDFISEIAKTEEMLKNSNKYTVNYNDFVFEAYKTAEYDLIEKIVISYKGKQINKNLAYDMGAKDLKSYYFDKETGLFILTFQSAPVADLATNYIIAFDGNGNIKLDSDTFVGNIYIDESNKSIIHSYHAPGGSTCECLDTERGEVSSENVCSSVQIYQYFNNKIEKFTEVVKRFCDLKKCN